MPTTCFVYGCRSGLRTEAFKTGKKWHFFAPPRNDRTLLAKWNHMCFRKDKKLTAASRVCHEHFTDDQIIKGIDIPMFDGTVHHSEYTQWSLKAGAYPCDFSQVEALPLKMWRKEEKKSKRRVLSCMKNTCEVECQALSNDETMGNEEDTNDDNEVHVENTSKDIGIQVSSTSTNNFEALYKKWKKRCYRAEAALEKAKGQPREGVFIPFQNLNSREQMFARSLARKANLKKQTSMRYSARHLVESMNIACKGKRVYNFIRSNNIQVLPHHRTVQKLRAAGCAKNKRGLNLDNLQLLNDAMKTKLPNRKFFCIKFDEVYTKTGVRLSGMSKGIAIEGVSDAKGKSRSINDKLENREPD